jgi:hypothetical protein
MQSLRPFKSILHAFSVAGQLQIKKPLAPGEGYPPFGASGITLHGHTMNQIEITCTA